MAAWQQGELSKPKSTNPAVRTPESPCRGVSPQSLPSRVSLKRKREERRVPKVANSEALHARPLLGVPKKESTEEGSVVSKV